MAIRIDAEKFQRMCDREARRWDLYRVTVSDSPLPSPMVHLEEHQGPIFHAVIHRKPIQSLVDKPRQAKPILRNLLRWAKEHGAR